MFSDPRQHARADFLTSHERQRQNRANQYVPAFDGSRIGVNAL